MRLTSKIVLRALAAFFAAAAIIVAAAAWRLSEGPISVAFLSPYVEESLGRARPDLDVRVKIENTVLAWRGFDRGLDIVVIGLEVLDEGGGRIGRIPEMAVSFDVERLYAGDFVPGTVDIVGANLNLRREQDGTFGLGLEDAEGDMAAISSFLREFTRAPEPNSGPALRRISVLDASVSYEDRRSGVVWRAPSASLIVNRDTEALAGDLIVEIEVGQTTEDFHVSALFDYVTRTTYFAVDFVDFDPSGLGQKDETIASLTRLGLPLTGRIEFQVSDSGRFSNVAFDVAGTAGGIDLAPVFDELAQVDQILASGVLDPVARSLVFERLDLQRGDAVANLTGNINATESGPFVSLGGQISGFTPQDIDAYWPPRFALPVHAWFREHIKAGLVTEGTIRLNIGPEQLEGGSLSEEAAEARLVVEGVTATYYGDLPPITDGSGVIRLTGDSFDLDLDQGMLDGLILREGTLQMIETAPRSWDASLEVVASGTNEEALQVIDSKPLRLAERFGIEPKNVGGVSATRVRLGFPVRGGLTLDDVSVAAASNLREAALAQVFGGLDLSDGNMTLEITKAGLRAEGSVALNNVPLGVLWEETFQPEDTVTTALRLSGRFDDAAREALGFPTGPFVIGDVDAIVDLRAAKESLIDAHVEVDLGAALVDVPLLRVTKVPARAARASFVVRSLDDGGTEIDGLALESDVLSASGVVELGPDRVLRRIDFGRLAFGRTEVAASIRPRAPEGFIVAVNGPRIDAGPFFDAFFDQTSGDIPPINLSVTTREMILSDRRTLFDLIGEFNYVDELESLRASGSINNEAPLAIELVTTPEGPRRLTISGDNAGGLARTTGLFDDAVGGNLLVSASLRDSARGPVIDGRMEIEDLQVRQATSLSRVLTLASLTGILETLDGEGLQFSRADVPFRFHNGILEIIDARAFGPSLGITLDGEINSRADEVSMFGTLIPAYTINSVLGEIPLIGTLLVGRQGEGVFALTYGIRGPVEQPVITVNPLTALAPGFLRNFFAIFTGGAQPDPEGRGPFLEDQPG